MPCTVATGSWDVQLAMVTPSDSSASRACLCMVWAHHTCCPSPPISGDDRCTFGSWSSSSKSCCQLLTATCSGASCACFRAGPSVGTTDSADAFQRDSWDTVLSGTEMVSPVAVPAMESTSKDPQCQTHSAIKTIATANQVSLPGIQMLLVSRGPYNSAKEVMLHLIVTSDDSTGPPSESPSLSGPCQWAVFMWGPVTLLCPCVHSPQVAWACSRP